MCYRNWCKQDSPLSKLLNSQKGYSSISLLAVWLFLRCKSNKAFTERIVSEGTISMLKCIWSEISFSIFWKFNILKTLFLSFKKVWRFYNTWKLCDFARKSGLRIARPKCPNDVVLWARLRDCNTIRRLLAIHNINILVVSWGFKESTQFRIVRHVVLLQKPFLLINSVHNTTSQDEIEQ